MMVLSTSVSTCSPSVDVTIITAALNPNLDT